MSAPQSAPYAGSGDNLWHFAQANCLSAYFEKRHWNLQDIRAISGSFVELGDAGAETYEEIAIAVRSWNPEMATKQDIDVALLKCFHLKESERIVAIVDQMDGD